MLIGLETGGGAVIPTNDDQGKGGGPCGSGSPRR